MKIYTFLFLTSIALLGLAQTYSAACITDSQCNNGKCQSNVCVCTKGYVTFGGTSPCNYQQKDKLTAFLLSFLIGNLGADWFYLAEGNAGKIIN